MRVLVLGGTGNISTAITSQLLQQGSAEVVHFNRGQREAPSGVSTLVGDRRNFDEFERQMQEAGYFDCVIDMIGYLPDEVESAVRAFKGRVGHYIFCSTVDVYTKQAEYYPIDEAHSRNALPSFPYAYNKVLCESLLFAEHDEQSFPVTIIRPAQTYGGKGFAVPSISHGTYHMKRLREGRPIIVHGDGTSIWVACHRDDVARAFVNAIGNRRAMGRAYNATGEELMTFDGYWRTVAKALGAPEPQFVHIPTDVLARLLPKRSEWCKENFQHDNIFDNFAARRDLGFQYTVTWADGIRAVIRELDAERAIENCAEEPYYDKLLDAWNRCCAQLDSDTAGLDD